MEDSVVKNTHLNGIMTVTVTPFTKGQEVDFEAYGRILDFVTKNGVQYVIPCGTTGEYFNLSTQERKAILKFVIENVRSRARLFAATNSARSAETLELSEYAKELGYEGLMLAAPFYSLPTTAELVEHFLWLHKRVELPILLYNFPARTGVDMSPAFLEGIRKVKGIFAIKESSGSTARMHELLTGFEDRLEIVCGADDQALEYFLWGSRSWVAGASNFLPAQHVALYEACVMKQDYKEGRRLMMDLLPMFMLMEQGGKYLQYCKYGCELAGVPVGDTRRPLLPLSADEKAIFRKFYERAAAAKTTRAAAE
jgi:4-hydroxy-tetrahydrodipicolinate synthase